MFEIISASRRAFPGLMPAYTNAMRLKLWTTPPAATGAFLAASGAADKAGRRLPVPQVLAVSSLARQGGHGRRPYAFEEKVKKVAGDPPASSHRKATAPK